MLEILMRSRAEVAVLGVVLFSESLHLREIARRAGVSPSEAKRELWSLSSLGIVGKRAKGNRLLYSPNARNALLPELKRLYLKTESVIPGLAKALKRVKGIDYAFVYGSAASGAFTEKSDIDILLIGGFRNEIVEKICFDAQLKTPYELNYFMWSRKKFGKKLDARGAFVNSVLSKPKIWLVGDEDEFERNAEEARDRKNRGG